MDGAQPCRSFSAHPGKTGGGLSWSVPPNGRLPAVVESCCSFLAPNEVGLRPFFPLGVVAVAFSLACSDRLPTRPDASASSSAAGDEGAHLSQRSRPSPRVLAPREPIGPPIRLLQVGNWGSPQSPGLDNRLLTVSRTSAILQSECSNGVIGETIFLDATGRFDVFGTYQIQAGPTGPPRPARFVGLAYGETLTLTVTLTGEKQTFGPFTLTFGQVPKIGYCPIV